MITGVQLSEYRFKDVRDRNYLNTIGLVCDVRLGILFIHELSLVAIGASFVTMSFVLIAAAVSWLPTRLAPYSRLTYFRTYILPCFDLTVTATLLYILPRTLNGGFHLSLAYVFTSALLIGLTSTVLPSIIWVCGVFGALVYYNSPEFSITVPVAVASIASIGIGVLLGSRLNTQFQESHRFILHATTARAEERAVIERLTIAQDLHDSLAKSVHGIRMLAETLDNALSSENHSCSNLSHILFESADEASMEARLVLDGLRTGSDADIAQVLSQEARRWSTRTGLFLSCNCSSLKQGIFCSPEATWQLQRILGEILTNIEKHAEASSVVLRIRQHNESLLVEVTDDGIGISDDAIMTSHLQGHYGLVGLQERAQKIGATLTINSRPRPGVGVRTEVCVPISSIASLDRN